MGPARTVTTAACAIAWLAACGGTETTTFPPGLEPLQVVATPLPAGTPDAPFPESVTTRTGEGDGYEFAEARGYVRASLAAVYAAMREPEVCVDRRSVDRWSVTTDVEPDYAHSFRVRNEVDDFITVEFDLTWRLGVSAGTEELPEVVHATWQKTWGTTFIRVLRGSLIARKITEEVTEVELVEHLDAATGGIDPAVSYLRDFHASIAAQARGEPLPHW